MSIYKLTVALLLIIPGSIFSNPSFKYSGDSAYCNAIVCINNSRCIGNNIRVDPGDILVWFADEILKLNRPEDIDTNSSSFYKNGIPFRSSRVIDTIRALNICNSVSDDIFKDTSKFIFVVFFSEIKNNYFIAEAYLFNYFPILEIGKQHGLNKNIGYRRSYEYLKDFDIVSRFLFVVSGNEIVSCKCH